MNLLLGFGGNIGDPRQAFRAALERLGACHPVQAVSALYRTDPEGPPQARFFNLVAMLEVTVSLRSLLEECRGLEIAAGRDRLREERWGPRPLDLDLLMAPGLVLRGPCLELPHPRFHSRAFALVPAAELAPEWEHPLLGRSLGELARGVDSAGLERVRRFEL